MRERSRLSATSARWLSLVAILTAGLLVTFFRIGDPSLWLDEAYTWWFSRMGFTEMLYAARVDGVNPPLYYILSWTIAGMFGTGEAALRGLSRDRATCGDRWALPPWPADRRCCCGCSCGHALGTASDGPVIRS